MTFIDKEILINILGACGAALILLGFYRTSIGRWTNRSMLYELDNLVGASCLIAYQLYHHAYITLTLNIVWAMVAIRGVTSIAERRKKSKKRRKR